MHGGHGAGAWPTAAAAVARPALAREVERRCGRRSYPAAARSGVLAQRSGRRRGGGRRPAAVSPRQSGRGSVVTSARLGERRSRSRRSIGPSRAERGEGRTRPTSSLRGRETGRAAGSASLIARPYPLPGSPAPESRTPPSLPSRDLLTQRPRDQYTRRGPKGADHGRKGAQASVNPNDSWRVQHPSRRCSAHDAGARNRACGAGGRPISSRSSTSPGRTTRRKRTPSMPAKSGTRGRSPACESTPTAPACASASTMSTPGMMGIAPGKCPRRYRSSPRIVEARARRGLRRASARPRSSIQQERVAVRDELLDLLSRPNGVASGTAGAYRSQMPEARIRVQRAREAAPRRGTSCGLLAVAARPRFTAVRADVQRAGRGRRGQDAGRRSPGTALLRLDPAAVSPPRPQRAAGARPGRRRRGGRVRSARSAPWPGSAGRTTSSASGRKLGGRACLPSWGPSGCVLLGVGMNLARREAGELPGERLALGAPPALLLETGAAPSCGARRLSALLDASAARCGAHSTPSGAWHRRARPAQLDALAAPHGGAAAGGRRRSSRARQRASADDGCLLVCAPRRWCGPYASGEVARLTCEPLRRDTLRAWPRPCWTCSSRARTTAWARPACVRCWRTGRATAGLTPAMLTAVQVWRDDTPRAG